ncbi:MAG: cell division protein FtsZ [Rhodospirillales bacterium]|nr:cell division protein FtsZ [Rhodospirillales bacterium]
MTLNLTVPKQLHTDFTPRITVMGVGGGGTNAVGNMIAFNLQGVDFVVANTDAQQLMHSKADRRIQLGPHLTQGLGAGAKPEIGRAAAEEAADELDRHLDGVHMLFVTAGMGGGTGTGAAPVIARMARERNILTVGVVTKPFTFEGVRRARAAEAGIEQLQQYVDTLIIIPNQNLFRLANERTGWREAFKMADHVLYMGVRGVTDLIVSPGLVNLDFADIRTVMAEMGKAMMGTGEAEGENRAARAAEAAINNPLLEDTTMSGAKGLLINITGGEDMTLFEVDQAMNRIREEVDEEANILFGSAIDENANGRMRVSVVATGIDRPVAERPRLVAVGGSFAAEAIEPQSGFIAPAGDAISPRPAPGTRPLGLPSVGAPIGSGVGASLAAFSSPSGASPAPSPQTPMATSEPRPLSLVQAGQIPFPPVAAVPPPAVPAGVQSGLGPSAAQPRPAPAAHAAVPMPRMPESEGHRASGLFAEAPVETRFGTPHARAQSRRTSIFQAVTRALPWGTAAPPAPAQAPDNPSAVPQEVSVRLAAGDELGLDIPAFLRKQTS